MNDECCICLDFIAPDEEAVLRCGHQFHASCVLRALERNGVCPLCRTQQTWDDRRLIDASQMLDLWSEEEAFLQLCKRLNNNMWTAASVAILVATVLSIACFAEGTQLVAP